MGYEKLESELNSRIQAYANEEGMHLKEWQVKQVREKVMEDLSDSFDDEMQNDIGPFIGEAIEFYMNDWAYED